jgi:hypothetical protein
MVGADDVSQSLDASRDYWKEKQKQYGGDTFTGKVASTVGSIAPALLFPEAAIPNMVMTAGLFAFPAVRDTYDEKKKEGMSDGLAAAHAALAGGVNMFMPGVASKGSKALNKLVGGGEGAMTQLGLSAAEGVGFTAADTALHKGINEVAGQKDESSWLPSAEDAAVSAAAFPFIRGAHMAMGAPAKAAAKAEQDKAAAKAAQDIKDKADQQQQQHLASPEYAQQVTNDYLAAEKAYQQAKDAHTKPDAASPTYAADQLRYKENEERLADLKNQRDELAAPYMDLVKADRVPQPPAEQPPTEFNANQNALDDALATTRAAHTDAINRAAKAAQSGDFDTATAAQAEVTQHAQRLAALQRLQTPKAPVPRDMPASELEKRVTSLQSKYAQALRMNDMASANAHLQELQNLRQQLDAAKANEAELAKRQQDMQDQTVGDQPHNPMSQFMADSDALRTGIGSDEYKRTFQVRNRPGTTEQEQQGLFGDVLQPGNKDTYTSDMYPDRPGIESNLPDKNNPINTLRTQIQQLTLRPNLPDATKTQLDNYAKALEHPAMADPNNQRAQNALEDIKDNVNRIAYRGEGQGVVRPMVRSEMDSQIQTLRDRIDQNNTDQLQMRKDLESAPFEQQPMQRKAYEASVQRGKDLATQMSQLVSTGRKTDTLTYDKPLQQAVAGGEPVTEKQTDNSKKWIEGAAPRAGDVLSKWQLDNASEEDLTTLQTHLNEEWAKKSKMEQGNAEEAARTGAKPSHPFLSGNEVMHVNQEPTTTKRWEGGESPKERINAEQPNAGQGTTRVERGGRDVLGVERAGPDDASFRHEMRGLSPEDQHTMGIWDEVFGADSPANNMVVQARAGLDKTVAAVDTAKKALGDAQSTLLLAEAKLKKAMRSSPELAPARILQGQELQTQRAAERAQHRLDTAQEVAKVTTRTADSQIKEAQLRATYAREAVETAKKQAADALGEFKKEWLRIQRSGDLTPEFMEYMYKHQNVGVELAEAEKALKDVLSRSPAKLQAAEIEKRMLHIGTRLSAHPGEAAKTLVDVLGKEVPKVTQLMGPRVGQLVSNVLQLRVAHGIVGEAQRLANAHEALLQDVAAKQQTLAEKAQSAIKTIEAAHGTVSQANVRAEILRHEAESAMQTLTDLRTKIEDAVAATPVSAEQNNVKTAKENVGRAEQNVRIEQLQASSKIAEAQTNVQRAEDTRKMLFENEQAAREGKTLPLLDRIHQQTRDVKLSHDRVAEDMKETREIYQFDVNDDRVDAATLQRHIEGLDALEEKLTGLLQENMHTFMDAQDKVQTLIDSNALLSSDIPGTDVEGGQRVADKAMTVAELRHLAAETARTKTQRDTVLGTLDKQLEANRAVEKRTPVLEEQIARLTRLREEKAGFFAKRLGELAERQSKLEPERDTAPDPEVRGRLVESLENLKAAQRGHQVMLDDINAQLDRLYKARNDAIKRLSDQGESKLETMRRLGLSDREQSAPAIRAALFKSLEHQRTEEAKADKQVDDAYNKMHDAQRQVFENSDLSERATLRDAYIRARNAYRDAVDSRATLHDHLMYLERQQLEMAKELMKAKEKPVKEVVKPLPKDNENRTPSRETAEDTTTVDKGFERMTQELESGVAKGPESTAEDPALTATKERVAAREEAIGDRDSVQGRRQVHQLIGELSKEVGSLRSQFEGIMEAHQDAKSGERKISKASVAVSKAFSGISKQSTFSRGIADATVNTHTKNRLIPLQDRIRFLEDKIEELKTGRKPTLQRLVSTQPSEGVREQVTRNKRTAGDPRTGTQESKNRENKSGTGNPAKERKAAPDEPSFKQVVTEANKDTGKGMALRHTMEQAQLEREADAAQKARGEAQNRYDIVMKAPNASENAKKNVTALLEQAKAAAKAADKALVEGTKQADTSAQAENDDPQRFRGTSGANDTPLSVKNISSLNKGDTRSVVADIAENSSNPIARRVAARIEGLLGDVKTRLVDEMPGDYPDAPGGISKDGKTVSLNRETGLSEESVLHENVHAATMHELSKPEDQLTKDQLAAKRELEALHAAVKELPGFDNAVINEGDLHEFVAEGHSSRPVQELMGKAEWQPKLTMWQGFKRAIFNLLGIKTPPNGTMLDRMLELSEKFMKAPEGSGGGTDVAKLRMWGSTKESPLQNSFVDRSSKLEKFKNAKGARWLATEQAMFNHLASVYKVLEQHGDFKNSGVYAAYAQYQAAHLMNVVHSSISDGAYGFIKDDLGNKVLAPGHGPAFSELAEKISKLNLGSSKNNMDGFQSLVMGLHAEQVGWDKLDFKDPAKLRQEYAANKQYIDAHPEVKHAFEEANKVYQGMNRALVDLVAETHSLPPDVIADMRKLKNYIPMYRVNGDSLQLLGLNGGPRVIGDIRKQPWLHELAGGSDKLMPLEEAIIRNTSVLTGLALRNHASTQTAYHLQSIGKDAGVMQIKRGTGGAGADVVRFTQKPDPTRPDDKGDRYIVIDTKGTSAEGIPTDLLVRSLAGIHQINSPLLKIASSINGLLRSGVTRMPSYVISQTLKDAMNASMLGSVKTNPVGAAYKSAIQLMKGYANTSPEHHMMQKYGSATSSNVISDAGDMHKIMLQMTAGKGESGWDKFKVIMDTTATAAEGATRAQILQDVKKSGGSDLEAVYKAAQSMDFGAKGADPAVRFVGQMVPFFHSSMTGINNFIHAMKGDMTANDLLKSRTMLAQRAIAMGGFAVTYALMMEDDDEWKQMSLRDKMEYFHLPLGTWNGEKVKIGIPFQPGVMFYSLPIALVENWKKEFSREDFKTVAGLFASEFVPNFDAQILKGTSSVIANYDMSMGAPIESAAMQRLSPEQRYSANTSEICKQFSKRLVDAGIRLSPVQCDYLAQSYFGQMPLMLAKMADDMVSTLPADVKKPTKHLSAGPMSRFFQKAVGTDDMDHLYEIENKAMEIKSTVDKMENSGRGTEARAYINDHRFEMAAASVAADFKKPLSELSLKEQVIRNKPNMDPDVKQEQIDAILRRRAALAERFRTVLEKKRESMAASAY